MTHWVVDASPLIFLAKLERLALLHQSSSEVYVPPQVLADCLLSAIHGAMR
jgi:predicted nucleic acid-binding protein